MISRSIAKSQEELVAQQGATNNVVPNGCDVVRLNKVLEAGDETLHHLLSSFEEVQLTGKCVLKPSEPENPKGVMLFGYLGH